MKKIFGLLTVFLMISANCFAMTFSQPVKTGRVGNFDQCPYRGFEIEGATSNDGTRYVPTRDYQYKDKIVYTRGCW